MNKSRRGFLKALCYTVPLVAIAPAVLAQKPVSPVLKGELGLFEADATVFARCLRTGKIGFYEGMTIFKQARQMGKSETSFQSYMNYVNQADWEAALVPSSMLGRRR